MKPLQINNLSLEQKVGQMLLARPPRNDRDRDVLLAMVRERRLGGIHMHSDQNFLERLLAEVDYPLLVCENMENGYRLSQQVQFPGPMGVAATGDTDAAYEFARMTAVEARRAGYNLVFGPIVDLATNPAASCVGPRAFGAEKDLVAAMACAAIRGYQDEGMVVTAKHYPGFGESAVDSHIGMVYLKADKATLCERELHPYLEATRKADLSGVMVGHIMVPAVDEKFPASLSPALIGLLRETGFDGLIMTDSLAMVGLTNWFGLEACHGMAMRAGNDMVMTSYRVGPADAYQWMLDAVRGGGVKTEQVDAAVRRVAAAQARTLQPPRKEQLSQADVEKAWSINARAVCLRLQPGVAPAIDPAGRHLFLVQKPNSFTDATGAAESDAAVYACDEMEEVILSRFPQSSIGWINEYPGRAEMERACGLTMGYESVVFIAVSRTEHYAGSSDLTRRTLALLAGLESKLQAVVLVGNPYAAREFLFAKRIVFAFDGAWCRTAALDVLAGKRQATGTLPVTFQ